MTTFPAVLTKKEPANGPRRVSLVAYFRAEEKALDRSEFHAGKIIKMSGANFNHNQLAVKVAALMGNFIEDNNLDFRIGNSDTKIRVEALDKVLYPDAVVVCAPPQFFQNRKDTITNPLLIVEVQSKSTGKDDLTVKFDDYRTIPSFKEYVLVYQESKFVIIHTKQADGSWLPREYGGDDATAMLSSIGDCPLPLKRLYRGLDF